MLGSRAGMSVPAEYRRVGGLHSTAWIEKSKRVGYVPLVEAGAPAAQGLAVSPDLRGSGGRLRGAVPAVGGRLDVLRGIARHEPQICFEILQRRRKILHVVREQAAIAQFGECRRIDREEQIGNRARLRERAHAHVEALQVDEHPNDDVLARGGAEEPGMESSLLAEIVAHE